MATGTYTEVVKVTGGKNFTLEAAGPNVVIAALDHQSNGTPSTVKVKGITFDNSVTTAGWFTGTAPNIAPCVGAWEVILLSKIVHLLLQELQVRKQV